MWDEVRRWEAGKGGHVWNSKGAGDLAKESDIILRMIWLPLNNNKLLIFCLGHFFLCENCSFHL